MSAEPKLSSLTRSKLSLSVSNRDGLSLHRWVLLKNSILHSQHTDNDSLSVSEPPLDDQDLDTDADPDADTDTDAEAEEDETTAAVAVAVLSSFMFPDAGKFASSDAARHSEEQWLDSLLETLGDDSDDDDDEEEEDEFTGPHCADDFSLSPMSSSDDLHHHHHSQLHDAGDRPAAAATAFYSPPDSISVPYTMPYLVPHCDQDDLLDTIDDTSDDESDAPATPSLGRSSSSVSLVEPASVSPPSRLRPRVYVDPFFDSFEIDPLPFSPDHLHHHHHPYNSYHQEC